jgi:hypothetical protein
MNACHERQGFPKATKDLEDEGNGKPRGRLFPEPPIQQVLQTGFPYVHLLTLNHAETSEP